LKFRVEGFEFVGVQVYDLGLRVLDL
jgi:hypothetical protein